MKKESVACIACIRPFSKQTNNMDSAHTDLDDANHHHHDLLHSLRHKAANEIQWNTTKAQV